MTANPCRFAVIFQLIWPRFSVLLFCFSRIRKTSAKNVTGRERIETRLMANFSPLLNDPNADPPIPPASHSSPLSRRQPQPEQSFLFATSAYRQSLKCSWGQSGRLFYTSLSLVLRISSCFTCGTMGKLSYYFFIDPGLPEKSLLPGKCHSGNE